MRQIFWIYITVILLINVLPLNFGNSSMLTNNYTLHIRWDYLLHVLAYSPLPVLSIRYGNRVKYGDGQGYKYRIFYYIRRPAFIALFSLMFAMITEMTQYFLSYRSFNINDMAGNLIGVMVGALIFGIYRLIKFKFWNQ